MKNISEYTDYRLLLKDYYESAKKNNPYFSYSTFSMYAGITSKGLLYNIITGKRRLSLSHITGIAKAMKLNKNEFEYFEHLVSYNNARTINDRKRFFERMTSVKVNGSKQDSHPQLVRKEQYRFYSLWYHAVVRSLIDLFGFNGDYEKLARSVYPAITVAQAKRSVALLKSLGFIVQQENGNWVVVDKTITSAPEVISLAIHNYHMQSAEIAKKALDELPRDRRNFTAVTLGVSASAYKQICKELENFRTRLLELTSNDNNNNEKQGVYQLNLQLFSVSRENDTKG